MTASSGYVDLHDLDSDSAAFCQIRVTESSVALGFGIESDGDLDLVLTHKDARRLARALLEATAE